MLQPTSYQTAIARAVVNSVLHESGRTFTVEAAAGSGMRELSSQIKLLLMSLHVNDGVSLLKVAPEGAAGPVRLVGHLRGGSLRDLWHAQPGVGRLGLAETRFVGISTLAMGGPDTARAASPRGLIEVAEAQLLSRKEYERLTGLREDRVTTVLYGTPWNGHTWFEELKQRNRELEAGDGIQRHFRVTWEQAAAEIPGYRAQAERVRAALGEAHPTFQTRYALRPLAPYGPLLEPGQLSQPAHQVARRHAASPGNVTVASVVITRRPQHLRDAATPPSGDRPVTAVVTVASVRPGDEGLDVVDHRWIQASDSRALADRIAKVTGEAWQCAAIHIEDTVADDEVLRGHLARAMGDDLRWASSSTRAYSARALELLAHAHTARLGVYAADASPEHRALARELDAAQATYRTDATLSVGLPRGDEGFLRGLMLIVEAAAEADLHPAKAEVITALAS